ncbi:unnamed protein product [Nesidiocoris tenuis]|uniref:Uncharacterized protein n=1 Tax=Nesidiocoris tenuis TaxID=355587 RepID=A0A6H5HE87_9HEMI|nr:unnamed protein product [Nesidiocoris tenuis]
MFEDVQSLVLEVRKKFHIFVPTLSFDRYLPGKDRKKRSAPGFYSIASPAPPPYRLALQARGSASIGFNIDNLTQENTIPFEHWSRADSPARRRAALPEPEPGGAEPGNPSPAARHGSASRRRYDSEDLRPARMFVCVISCSAILLVRIACSRPQPSAVFPPSRSRRARCRAVETFCGSRSATPRSMQPEDIGQRGATRPNVSYH